MAKNVDLQLDSECYSDGVLGVESDPVRSPLHDRPSVDIHLNFLGREKYLFQFLSDSGGSLPHGCAASIYCTPDEVWPLIERWNTPEHGVGVFVTVNPTKGSRRKSEDITGVAALFIDADGETQRNAAVTAMRRGPKPGLIVRTARGFHAYWRVSDVPPCDFRELQRNMAERFGTDPSVHDLPRVMRLGGTLHLKEEPCLVTIPNCDHKVWGRDELVSKLGLAKSQNCVINLFDPGKFPARPPLQGPCDLAAGIFPPLDLPEIESAGLALAHNGKLSDRAGWRDLWLFPLTHAARMNPEHGVALKDIFDRISKVAGGSTSDNERQWAIEIAATPTASRTLASTFLEASKNGWVSGKVQKLLKGVQSHIGTGVPRPVPVDLNTTPSITVAHSSDF